MTKAVAEEVLQEKIIKSFLEYKLEHGQKPESIYAFCKKIKIKESAFYGEFSSFSHIEKAIWKGFFKEALATAQNEAIYESYSVREKFLAFFYTWIEVLNTNRSFVLESYTDFAKPIFIKKNPQFTDFKHSFYDFANELLMEARETREVEQRAIPQIMKHYPDIFWAKALFILNFWINDTSQAFEKTDTMIEKSVNTVFDLLARSPLDSLFDLGKFIFQNRK